MLFDKAYDDYLYAWVGGDRRSLKYSRLSVKVFKIDDMKRFEGDNCYMGRVSGEIIKEL